MDDKAQECRSKTLELDPSFVVYELDDHWEIRVGWMGGSLSNQPTEDAAWIRAWEIAETKYVKYATRSPPVRIEMKKIEDPLLGGPNDVVIVPQIAES